MADAEPSKPTPTTWYQWVLLYPGLLLALGSSLPLIWREFVAWQKGVESSKLALVQEQEALWKRNLGCAPEASTWEMDLPFDHTRLQITMCKKTGDILIRYFMDDDPAQYRWVRLPEHLKKRPDKQP